MTNVYEGVTTLLNVLSVLFGFAIIFFTKDTFNNIMTMVNYYQIKNRVNAWHGILSTKNIENITGIFFHEPRSAWFYGVLRLPKTNNVDEVKQNMRNVGLSDLADHMDNMKAEMHEQQSNVVPVEGYPITRLWAYR